MILIMSVALLMIMTGCKPTENNYREAYDAAMQKKKASSQDDVILPAGVKFHKAGTADERKVDGETVKVINMRLKLADTVDGVSLDRYNVAVARYKMLTNARAQAADLRREGNVSGGENAFTAEGVDSGFYVVVATFPELRQAASFARKYAESHPRESLVGLEEGIIIIEN